MFGQRPHVHWRPEAYVALQCRFRGVRSTDNRHARSTNATSDALLQGGHGERLDDGAGGLRLHHLHLAEDLLLAGLCGRLDAGLDLAQARESEDAKGTPSMKAPVATKIMLKQIHVTT